MGKKFIITVDTEGDNLWTWSPGNKITTENAKYIMRFQNLCEKYNLIPTYLVNYEMAQSELFVRQFKEKSLQQKCEIGMHLHAWNTPPAYRLNNIYGGLPYITEYPEEIIYQKHKFLKEYIEKRFEVEVKSYRSGRWATNQKLFNVLDALGFLVDCSVTPGINLSRNKGMSNMNGNDYRREKIYPHKIGGNLIEIPMTTAFRKSFKGTCIKQRCKNLLKGEELWLRTAVSDYNNLIRLMNLNGNLNYVEFMIHSSELMPGGSPYFKTIESIEQHYVLLDKYFKYVTELYEGISLRKYGESLNTRL